MEYVAIPLAALIASTLRFYSGFGLGTLLMPVLPVFMPLPAAIAATAVVHGSNNLFKIAMVGVRADKDLALKFGVPAIIAALAGAVVAAAIAASMTGVLIGLKFLKKVTIFAIQLVTAAMLGLIAVFLGAGLI